MVLFDEIWRKQLNNVKKRIVLPKYNNYKTHNMKLKT